MNIWKWFKITASIAFLLLSFSVFILLGTSYGLNIAIKATDRYLPGQLRIHALKGQLFRHMHFEGFSYEDEHFSLQGQKAELKWHITSLYPLRISLEKLDLSALRLLHESQELMLDASFKTEGDEIIGHIIKGNTEIDITGPLNGPWRVHGKLDDLSQLHESLATLQSKVTLTGRIQNMHDATLNIRLSPGKVHLPQGTNPESIAFKSADITANYTALGMTLKGYTELDDNISSRFELNFPEARLNQAITADNKVKGKAHLTVESLKYFDNPLYHQILSDAGLFYQDLEGKLEANVKLDGTLKAPHPEGQVAMTEGRVILPKQEVTLYPITALFKSDGTTWQGRMQAISNKKAPITLTGEGKIKPSLTGEVVIEGHEFILMNNDEYYVEISPNLVISKKTTGLHLEGSMLVPKAHINPRTFAHSVRLTHDAVFVDEKVDPNPLNLTAKIALDFGEDVTVNLKGLQGHVEGMLYLKQQPKQGPTANGTLRLVKGYYEAYGQKLNIEQGELIFSGQAIDNPNLNLRAVRHFNQDNSALTGSNELFDFSDENLSHDQLIGHTTVGIIATGKLDAPHVKLYSSPPNLSQADILSMLLIGKPAAQASKSHGALLLQAMKAMNLDKGSKGMKMLQDFREAIGIDFDVKNDSLSSSKSDWTKTSVSIGKSINKRTYLRYNVGLFQENSSVFTLTYLLNKFLSIKVTASDVGSGLDVTYSHSD